jgi:hypothetical protein
MPVHDWSRVDAGTFHDFHHAWIEEIKRALNGGLLPDEYYAMAEQQAAGFGPDVLTLESRKRPGGEADDASPSPGGSRSLLVAPPKVRITAESRDFFRRKKSTIAVRHVSGDYIVAVVEVISPGNKSSKSAFKALVDKACESLEHRVHLLILDLFPPGKRDPQGIHGALWDEIADESFVLPPDKPLTLAAYESVLSVKAYVEPLAVGDVLPDMPLFLQPGAHVLAPLEATYEPAFAAVPRRWREVVEGVAGEPT